MTIKRAAKQDIDGWMNLVEKVKDVFPGLEIQAAFDEHKNAVLDFMDKDIQFPNRNIKEGLRFN